MTTIYVKNWDMIVIRTFVRSKLFLTIYRTGMAGTRCEKKNAPKCSSALKALAK